MRLIPALTAAAVAAGLYMVVFQRDDVMGFVNGPAEAPEPQTQPAAAPPDSAAPVIAVTALQSHMRKIDDAVVLRGQTEAVRQVDVRAETSAIVVSEPLRRGHFVTAGEILCKLDPGMREATLAEAEARLIEAEARVPEAEARLEEADARLEEAQIIDTAASRLIQGGFASETRVATAHAALQAAEAGVETARAGLQAAKATIQAAQAAIAAAQREIDRLSIHAPFAGFLESDTAELGSLMQPGSLCATVIQLDPIKIVGFVPETELDRIGIGAPAEAQLVSGRQVRGTVSYLSRSADPTTRTFRVEIAVPNPDRTIRDGQTAEILISTDGADAHFLPQSALTLNADGALGVRLVGDDNLVEFAPVRVLRDTAEGVWLAGLPDTADVIVVGQDFVTEGVRVRPSYIKANP